MTHIRLRFGDFILDSADRRLLRSGTPVNLNARYFDALVLLLRERGRLVGKQRFFDEVWAGSVVTDAALTQCIKEIRRQLGDDAGAPRFVRTVPGHGYSFIAAVLDADQGPERTAVQPLIEVDPPAISAMPPDPARPVLPRWLVDAFAATAGGATSGLVGGLLYGSILAFSPQSQGLGSLSVLLVLLVLCVLVGMAGALGVGLGIVAGQRIGEAAGWTLAGGAFGGLVIGGLVKLLGSDAFTLLVGRAPAGITGGLEGAAIGFAVAAGLLLGGGPAASRRQRPVGFAVAATGLIGGLIPLAGGSMMASSLARVAAAFDDSRLDMAPLGRLFGEPQFGAWAEAALGGVEGGLFGGCVVAALLLGRRSGGCANPSASSRQS